MANLNLYLYGSNGKDYIEGVKEFESAIDNISAKVDQQRTDDNFLKVINNLKEREKTVYKVLGNGNVEEGKKNMEELANQVYIDEPVRKEIINIVNNLFKPTITSKDNSLLNLTFDPKQKNFRMKANDKWVEDGQKYFEEYCEIWNKTVTSYSTYMNEVRGLLWNSDTITENSFQGVLKSFEIIKNNLDKVSNKEISISNLPSDFIEVLKGLNGSFANIIGNVTEDARFNFEDGVFNKIKKEIGEILFKRGDSIEREETGFNTNAKADGVFVINGKLNSINNSVTIPVTLKYKRGNQVKIHSGSLNSISQIIYKEGQLGQEFANDFANLALNMIYYIHFSDKTSEEVILVLRKILNTFAFSFLYGNSIEDRPYGNALFFAGFFPDVAEKGEEFSANYFTPVSKILETIYEYISIGKKNRDFVVNWAGFNFLDRFRLIMQIEKIKENPTQEKLTFSPIITESNFENRNEKGKRIYRQNVDTIRKKITSERENLDYGTIDNLFSVLSSKIGEQEISFPRGIITGEGRRKFSVFNKQRGGIIL